MLVGVHMTSLEYPLSISALSRFPRTKAVATKRTCFGSANSIVQVVTVPGPSHTGGLVYAPV